MNIGHNMHDYYAVICNGRSQHANLYHAHDYVNIGHSMLIFDINATSNTNLYNQCTRKKNAGLSNMLQKNA